MNSCQKLSFFAIAIILFLGSCSIEKRVHRSGYHVEWHQSKNTSEKQNFALIEPEEQNQLEKNDVRLIKPSPIENSLNGPDNSISASIEDDLVLTATKTNSIVEQGNTVSKNNKQLSATKLAAVKNTKKNIQQDNPEEGGGKSQIVALIICILIGVLGIHRFYLGHIGIGVLMLLTGGLCGILVLIDLIRIITGDLKPKGGEYSEKL